MRIPLGLLTEPVTVRTYRGESAYGPTYDAAVTTRCQLEPARRLVRGRQGDEVVSEATLRLSPALEPQLDLEALFAPESQVDVRGRPARVLEAKPHLHRGQLVYLEVVLT